MVWPGTEHVAADQLMLKQWTWGGGSQSHEEEEKSTGQPATNQTRRDKRQTRHKAKKVMGDKLTTTEEVIQTEVTIDK